MQLIIITIYNRLPPQERLMGVVVHNQKQFWAGIGYLLVSALPVVAVLAFVLSQAGVPA